MEIKIERVKQKGVMPPENELGFGKYFSDHMFVMDYDTEKGWHDARIVPFGNISLHPASTVLHYGAEIFEGLKAYRRADGGCLRLHRALPFFQRVFQIYRRISQSIFQNK